MILLPAIDIIDGCCVRLKKGDYSTAHKVADDVLETALKFELADAQYLHMVDLDGAKEKKPVNFELIKRVAKTLRIPVETGGGIRDLKAVEDYLEAGIARVILGSAAYSDRDFLIEAARAYGDSLAVGIDAKERRVKINGWLEDSGEDFIEFAKMIEQAGVGTIIFTDIGRDGMLEGPNLEQLAELDSCVSCRIVASGGISSLEDIKNLKAMGLYGAISGKAVYTGALPLEEAIRICRED